MPELAPSPSPLVERPPQKRRARPGMYAFKAELSTMDLATRDIEARRKHLYAEVFARVGKKAGLPDLERGDDPRIARMHPALISELSNKLTEVNILLSGGRAEGVY